jgi:chitin disaccharide deacetylase
MQLIVQGDDFGMCHAVNAGIEKAFVDGILTQASTMAACPWVDEALETAVRLGIPVGLHQTLTCDWDRLRWGPLTFGASLAGGDGIFPATVAEAAAGADVEEAVDELLAQAGRVAEFGLSRCPHGHGGSSRL